jgi:hypothetical protein
LKSSPGSRLFDRQVFFDRPVVWIRHLGVGGKTSKGSSKVGKVERYSTRFHYTARGLIDGGER